MNEFKDGDRVKRVESQEVGIVVEVDESDAEIPYKVQWDSGSCEWFESSELVLAEVDLGDPTMELLGLSTSVQDKHNRSMALHHAVDLAKAIVASGNRYDDIIEMAKQFEAYLKGN